MPKDNTLPRNSACLTCRSRKVKCDGGKPGCSGCRKSAAVKGENPDNVICRYDDSTGKVSRRPNAGVHGSSGNRKLTELENKIDALQRQINNGSHSHLIEQIYDETGVSPNRQHMANVYDIPNLERIEWSPSEPYNRTQQARIDEIPPFPASSQDDIFSELIYPGWPNDLPSPQLTRLLVTAYFTKLNSGIFVVSQERFMQHFDLPPKHPKFPHTALIHGMVAVVLTASLDHAFGMQDQLYWRTVGSEVMPSPSIYHAKRAKYHIDIAMENGHKLLNVAQAITLLIMYSYSSARFVETWLYTSLAIRVCPPLNLNHLETLMVPEASSAMKSSSVRLALSRASFMGSPVDDAEREERAAVFWLTFVCDRFASCNSSWCHAMDEEDITTFLPSPAATIKDPYAHAESLSIWSDSFFVSNPRGIVGPLQLYIKAAVLMGRVNRFIQRAPWPVGSGERMFMGKKARQKTARDVMETEEFKMTDADIVAFRLTFHRDVRTMLANMKSSREDMALLLAHSVAHSATIQLHEPFCTTQPNDHSMERCLSSARAILSSIYSLAAGTFDVNLVHPFVVGCWNSAGRTLVRECAIQQLRNNIDGQARAIQEVTTIIGVVMSMRTKLAEVNATGLRAMLENPSALLPVDSLEEEGATSKFQDPKRYDLDNLLGPGCGAIATTLIPDPGFVPARANHYKQSSAPAHTAQAHSASLTQIAPASIHALSSSDSSTPIELLSQSPSPPSQTSDLYRPFPQMTSEESLQESIKQFEALTQSMLPQTPDFLRSSTDDWQSGLRV